MTLENILDLDTNESSARLNRVFTHSLEARGQKKIIEGCGQESLVAAKFECPKGGISMCLRERKNPIDVNEWRCHSIVGENPSGYPSSIRVRSKPTGRNSEQKKILTLPQLDTVATATQLHVPLDRWALI
ncbi:hypothetical protein TNCV_4622971 [Trichonephila clavipes]|nr:hypothetical protein TNCV_4622971 [Trichonephila clavipes]